LKVSTWNAARCCCRSSRITLVALIVIFDAIAKGVLRVGQFPGKNLSSLGGIGDHSRIEPVCAGISRA
jgi:hypothetical protein